MRKRISEVIAETIKDITAAKAQRTKKPNRQERIAKRIVRELNEREEQRKEQTAQREQRERRMNFNDGCRTTAGKKRQGKGREIIPTTLGRIHYERSQRRTVSYGSKMDSIVNDRNVKYIAKQIITNGLTL